MAKNNTRYIIEPKYCCMTAMVINLVVHLKISIESRRLSPRYYSIFFGMKKLLIGMKTDVSRGTIPIIEEGIGNNFSVFLQFLPNAVDFLEKRSWYEKRRCDDVTPGVLLAFVEEKRTIDDVHTSIMLPSIMSTLLYLKNAFDIR